MGRVYTAPFKDITVNAAGDLLQISTDASTTIKILKWEITSNAVTPEALRLQTAIAGTAGSGGTGQSENSRDTGLTDASGASLITKNTTAASSLTNLEAYEWEQLGPIGEVFTPECQVRLGVSSSWVVILESTPTEFKMAGSVTWMEL